jgi:hypothetical protein
VRIVSTTGAIRTFDRNIVAGLSRGIQHEDDSNMFTLKLGTLEVSTMGRGLRNRDWCVKVNGREYYWCPSSWR